MLIKRVLSSVLAAAAALTCLALPAFADAEENARPEIPFTYDKLLTSTDKSIPAVSFDTDNWEKYVHLTPDASMLGLKMSQDKTTYYQGFSLKVSASDASDKLYFNMQNVVDSDNNPVYPDAQAEGAELKCPGIELRAEDFGLSCFDGCMISFMYKVGADVSGKLVEDSIYCFGTDENYNVVLSNVVQKLTFNNLTNDNVKQYRSQVLQIGSKTACSRIVFETPILSKLDSDVFCIDNISITLPEKNDNGDKLYIKSLDGYNASAKPQETIDEIEIKEKTSSVDVADAPEKQEGGHGIVIIIIVIVVVVAGGVVGFLFFKKKKQFY